MTLVANGAEIGRLMRKGSVATATRVVRDKSYRYKIYVTVYAYLLEDKVCLSYI